MILIPSPFISSNFEIYSTACGYYHLDILQASETQLTLLWQIFQLTPLKIRDSFPSPILSISSGNLIVYSVPPNDNLGVILHFSFCRPHQPPGPCSFISLPPPLLPPFGFSSHLTWPDGIGIAASGIVFFSNISTHGYQSPNIQTSRLVLYKFLSKHPLKKSVPFR